MIKSIIRLRERICIVAVVLACVFGLSAYADSPALRISSVAGTPGQEIDIIVSITDNPGIAAFTLKLEFDSTKLTPVSVEKGSVVAVGDIVSNPQGTEGFVSVFWVGLTDIATDGILFTVRFTINDDAKGRIPLDLSYTPGDICDAGFEDVYLDIFGGSIEVTEEQESAEDIPNPSPPSTSNTSGNSGVRTTLIPPREPKDTAQAPETANEPLTPIFADVDGYPWAINEIMTLAGKGIILGTSENTFSPANNIKRADFMILLVRMLGLTADFTENFADVPEDAYYYREIGIAKVLGLATGVGDNQFSPEAEITRQDMFVLAYRILIQQDNLEVAGIETLEQFNDNTLIAAYAKDALAALINNELVKGNENYINPLGLATRAETAVFIYRLDEFMNSHSV